jgi:crotonobetainyl-CoA:carnitine CoA-transferase CaiB-like acyl-CoA transferase
VIKVEEPRAGDPVRLAPPLVKGRSALATLLLSGSESIALDLKKDAGRRVLEVLLERADVLLESFRPGTLARLGFDPEALRERHPRLVVCSVSGWGQDGPYSARAGHDLTYQALSGTLAATAPAMPSFPAADATGAWAAVSSVLAALYERERTGRGARIDAALFDGAVHNNLVGWAEEAGGSRAVDEVGAPHGLAGSMPCYRLYPTADGGVLAVAPLEQHFWRRFCEAAGREDLSKLQYRESDEARDALAEAVAEHTLDEWREILAGVDLPVEPVLAPADAARHPQTLHRDLLRRGEDGLYRLGFPARIDGARPRAGGRVPELGEDTEPLLEELGEDADAELALLMRSGRGSRRRRGVGRRFGLKRMVGRWIMGLRK